MNFRGFRIQVVLLVCLVAVGLGLGIQYLHQQTQVINPLIEQLRGIPGVAEIRLETELFRKGSRILVDLYTEAGVPLGAVFSQVHRTLLDSGDNFAIQLNDTTDADLQRIFERMRIAIEEALITGEFTALEARIKHLAESKGVAWALSLDRDFIYLSLAKAENRLERVISRGENQGKIVVLANGGVTK